MTRKRARARRHHSVIPTLVRVFAVTTVASISLILTGAVVAFAVVSSWLDDLPDYDSPDAYQVAEATRVYSADGKLLARLYLENRTVVPMSAISTDLIEAVIAVEDARFYSHDGVDLQGIARAAVIDILAGDTKEGASTITQQYVRNTVLFEERTDISFARKAREAFLARELEKHKDKDEILELYLNAIYFGEGAYGAQAAAQTFFSKDAADLTLAEAALLAGMPQQPSRLSPFENPERALARRGQVLTRMLVNGYITLEEYNETMDAPLGLRRAPDWTDGIISAHYFVSHVRKLLQQEYSPSLVFEGGLEVHTTLDTRMQESAERAVFDFLDQPNDPDAALVSIDPRDGHIKALVGGEDYEINKFNLATQGRRQPGSSFKTYVLVAALEAEMSPARYFDSSSPAHIPTEPMWEVSNSEGRGRGMITLETATRSSVNTVFARLIWELNDGRSSGAQKVAEVARRMGITSDVPAYPSIALGSHNVTPLDMASAFGTLATNGEHFPPIAITKVIDKHGDVVFEAKPEGRRALDPYVAYAATQVHEGVITAGTGRAANIGRPAAGKTGTSQNYRDAWFVGYTPDLVTSVWVGYYERELPMLSVHGRRGFGGTLAAPIWAAYMKEALEGRPVLDFERVGVPSDTYTASSDDGDGEPVTTTERRRSAPRPAPRSAPQPSAPPPQQAQPGATPQPEPPEDDPLKPKPPQQKPPKPKPPETTSTP